MNNVGRILLERPGTSQQGSRRVVLRQSLSTPNYTTCTNSINNQSSVSDRRLLKSFTAPSPSTPTTAPSLSNRTGLFSLKKPVHVPNLMAQKLFQRLSILETEGYCSKHFSPQELRWATNNFNPIMVIGEGAKSRVYRAILEDSQTAAVKVLKTTSWAAEDLLREIDLLSRIKHQNIIRVIGYCDCRDVQAIVYELLRGSLKENLRRLDWSERMSVALGVAKALNYLHHCCDPPIIHRDVKSSNILLSDNFEPQVSVFSYLPSNNLLLC